MINNYIESIIDNHQKKFGLYFSSTSRDVIHESINKGIYAFQVIYFENRVEEIKYLDYKLCILEDLSFSQNWINHQNKMWSYDGGRRYQWEEKETLIFDPSLIRNIKIESIL